MPSRRCKGGKWNRAAISSGNNKEAADEKTNDDYCSGQACKLPHPRSVGIPLQGSVLCAFLPQRDLMSAEPSVF